MKRLEFFKEIKSLDVKELKARAQTLAEELMKLRFRGASGQVEHSHRQKEIRRNLARVNTLITSKNSASQQISSSDSNVSGTAAAK